MKCYSYGSHQQDKLLCNISYLETYMLYNYDLYIMLATKDTSVQIILDYINCYKENGRRFITFKKQNNGYSHHQT